MKMLNLAGSAAIGANVGRSSSEAVFLTVDDKINAIVAAMRKALAVSFGAIVVLAHCSDAQTDGKVHIGPHGSL